MTRHRSETRERSVRERIHAQAQAEGVSYSAIARRMEWSRGRAVPGRPPPLSWSRTREELRAASAYVDELCELVDRRFSAPPADAAAAERIELIEKLTAQGWTQRRIAEALHVSQPALCQWMHRHVGGLPMRRRTCPACGVEPHEAIVDAAGTPLWCCLGCNETSPRGRWAQRPKESQS